jgi:hypothetical protein
LDGFSPRLSAGDEFVLAPIIPGANPKNIMKLEFNIVPAHVLQTYVQTLYKNISRKPLENVDVGDNFTWN